jgi:ferredoxin
MKPDIDNKKCIGCGTCAAMCPEVFEVQGGKAIVKEEAPIDEKKNCIEEAESACPVDAISTNQE